MQLIHQVGISILSTILIASCAVHGDVESLLTDKANTENSIENEIQNNEATLLQDESLLEKRRAAVLLSDYITLEDNRYSLKLSPLEPAKIDIREELYQHMAEQIEFTYSTMAEAIERGADVDLMDIQSRAKSYKTPQTTVRNRSMSNASRSMTGGILYSSGNSSTSFTPTRGTTKINLKCGTNWAPVVTYTCNVTCAGSTKSYIKTGSVFCTRSFEAPISSSSSVIYLSFLSTDPNGSYCIWTPSF